MPREEREWLASLSEQPLHPPTDSPTGGHPAPTRRPAAPTRRSAPGTGRSAAPGGGSAPAGALPSRRSLRAGSVDAPLMTPPVIPSRSALPPPPGEVLPSRRSLRAEPPAAESGGPLQPSTGRTGPLPSRRSLRSAGPALAVEPVGPATGTVPLDVLPAHGLPPVTPRPGPGVQGPGPRGQVFQAAALRGEPLPGTDPRGVSLPLAGPAPRSRREARAGTGSLAAAPLPPAPLAAGPSAPMPVPASRRTGAPRPDRGGWDPYPTPGPLYPPGVDLLVTPPTRRERVQQRSRPAVQASPSSARTAAALRRKALLAGGLVVTLLGSVMVVNGQDSSFVDTPGQATSGQVSDR